MKSKYWNTLSCNLVPAKYLSLSLIQGQSRKCCLAQIQERASTLSCCRYIAEMALVLFTMNDADVFELMVDIA
jgi:hypothetical protein